MRKGERKEALRLLLQINMQTHIYDHMAHDAPLQQHWESVQICVSHPRRQRRLFLAVFAALGHHPWIMFVATRSNWLLSLLSLNYFFFYLQTCTCQIKTNSFSNHCIHSVPAFTSWILELKNNIILSLNQLHCWAPSHSLHIHLPVHFA